MQSSKFTTIKWASQNWKHQISLFLNTFTQLCFPFIVQDFTHFSQKKALKQKVFWWIPSVYFQNVAITLCHHLAAANVNCMRQLTLRAKLKIPSHTAKANPG